MQRYYGRLYQNQEPLQSFEWYFLKERAHYRDEECQEKGQPEWMRKYLIEKADRLIVQAEGPKRTKRVNDVFLSQLQNCLTSLTMIPVRSQNQLMIEPETREIENL